MLAGETFIGFPTELHVEFPDLIETIARIGNFAPRVVKREDEFITVLGNVALGHGIAVVPELMKTMSGADIVFRNIAADPVPQTSIAFVYGSDPSPSGKLLIRHMQRHALRNGGSHAAPPHNQDRITIPSALNLDPHPNIDPHPEVLARSASLEGCRPRRRGLALRGSALTRRAPQGEEMSQR
jgi:hypothetical protein